MDDFYLSKFQKQRGRNQTYPEQIIAYTSFRTQSLSRYVRNDTRLVRKNYFPMQKVINIDNQRVSCSVVQIWFRKNR